MSTPLALTRPLGEPEAAARDGWPLTEAQEGLWFAQRLDPANPIFNTGQCIEISGRIDVPRWIHAVAAALAEAEGLAIRVDDRDGTPRQIVDPRQRAEPQVVDLRGTGDPDAEAWRRIESDQRTPVDLALEPPVAEMLFVLADDRALWYQRAHHVVLDGYGTGLLTRRICDLYSAAVTGQPPASQPFGAYDAVLREDADYRVSPKRHGDASYWRQAISSAPDATGLKPGRAVTAHTALRTRVPLALSSPDSASLFAQPWWPDAVVAVVAAYLARHTGQDAIVVGVPAMERLGRAAARVPATTMNVLPIRVAIDDDRSVIAYAGDVSRQLREARRHGRYRAEQLRRDLGLVGLDHRLHGAIVNVVPFAPSAPLAGLTASVTTLSSGPIDDLTISVRAGEDGCPTALEIEANPDLYDEAEVRAHGRRLAAFLESAAVAARLADVPTATAAELASIEAFNDTRHPVEDVTLVDLIERTMTGTPDAIALVEDSVAWTYRELDRRTARLRDVLLAAGTRRGDVVAIAMPRSAELVAAIAAVVRAGAAYLPLDVTHPPARLARILETAQPRVVIADPDAVERFACDAPVVLLDAEWDLPCTAPRAVDRPRGDDPAYVIYTSGSTGEPKGVVVEHRAIVNRLVWMQTHYAFGVDDRILQKTPATFDVSVWEFFLSFISGGTLVVAPPEAHKDPAWIASLIRAHGVTTLHFVPSMLAAFVEEPSAVGLRLRRVICSGEALPASLRDRFQEAIDAELHNLYGPTEAAVDVTFWNASAGDRSNPVPIGFPVWNTRMYVLDSRLRPQPPGVSGDLFIAGVQLAREYLGREDLTTERFVPDPFVAGARMYRTGDVGYWREDGAIVFLGRSDHQVKIRGLRIELGEIEAVLARVPHVAHVAVVPVQQPTGDTQLVAYVVARGEALDTAALRDHAAQQLPDYMVPSAVVPIDALPLTRSGKLDRAALPSPDFASHATRGRSPSTALELAVARVFAEVLPGDGNGPHAISADDDFFALGGHSLLAVRAMARVRQEWQCTLGLGVLFAHPTVARLAAEIDRTVASARVSAVGDAADDGLQPLLTLTTSARSVATVFCIHPAGGLAWCYGALARALGDRVAVHGLQAPALSPSVALPETLEELVAEYVRRIRRVQPEGPYHLAGWSIGGIIGHAIGVALQDAGERVATLALLDAYPSDRWRLQPEPEDGAALRALLLIAGYDADALEAPLTRDAVIAHLRRAGHPLGELPDAALVGIVRVVHRNNQLVRSFHHRRYRGRVTYFRAALDHRDDGLSPYDWESYVDGRIVVHDVASRHAHLTGEAAVATIAPLLRRAILE